MSVSVVDKKNLSNVIHNTIFLGVIRVKSLFWNNFLEEKKSIFKMQDEKIIVNSAVDNFLSKSI